MNLCNDNHEEVCYEGRKCPCCQLLSELEDEQKDKQKCEEKADALADEIRDLRSTAN